MVMFTTMLETKLLTPLPLASLFAMGLAIAPALAEQNGTAEPTSATKSDQAPANQWQVSEDQSLVNELAGVVKTMEAEPHLADLLKKAKGVFIVPKYGREGYGRNGTGVVLVDHDNKWTDPAFYDFRRISLGPKVQASAGSVALLLMDQRAVDAFKNPRAFSLKAGSGLSIYNYSRNAKIAGGRHDIVMWTDVFRDFARVPVSISDISWDAPHNQAYYGRNIEMKNILDGAATNAGADNLKQILPG